ncbi:hypothetical protein [Endothiovibrio diazotrophicus]
MKRPDTVIVLEPGEKRELVAEVSWLSDWNAPEGTHAELKLQLHHAHDGGKPLEAIVPVTMVTPQLALQETRWLNEEGSSVLVTKFTNTGKQALERAEFNLAIAGLNHPLDTLTRPRINPGQQAEIAFPLPEGSIPDEKTRVTLDAAAQGYPPLKWHFADRSVVLPTPAWELYAALAALLTAALIALYYLRLYRHPLVVRVSSSPEALLALPLTQLPEAHTLLRRTRRWETVLESVRVSPSRINEAERFSHDDPQQRLERLTHRLVLTPEPTPAPEKGLFTLPLDERFPINLTRCLLFLPAAELDAGEALSILRAQPGLRGQVILLLHPRDEVQRTLCAMQQEVEGLRLAVPEPEELTPLLLGETPLEELARILSRRIQLSQISPYQTGGGVNRRALFFGRQRLIDHITNREPANYLVVGGRQLGKSSLLKALERHYRGRDEIHCHYLSLGGPDLLSYWTRSLGLEGTDSTAIERVLEESDRPHLFLIDEADRFVRADGEAGYPQLNRLRSLSESGRAWFILAGFWQLYRHATHDYQSPLKNFGETLTIGALEMEACRELAVKPMATMAIHWADEANLKWLIDATGQRANLVSIACNEILKGLDPSERTIDREDVSRALDSEALRGHLAGWQELSEVPRERLALRLVVYATIEQESFTLAGLGEQLAAAGADIPSHRLERLLERLQLAYVIGREQASYRYRVPLFVETIRAQEPQRLFAQVLREYRQAI